MVEYPRSEFVEEARTRKAQLRDKLAEKVFLNAEFYFDNENYSATEIYLTDLIADVAGTYPPSSSTPARSIAFIMPLWSASRRMLSRLVSSVSLPASL